MFAFLGGKLLSTLKAVFWCIKRKNYSVVIGRAEFSDIQLIVSFSLLSFRCLPYLTWSQSGNCHMFKYSCMAIVDKKSQSFFYSVNNRSDVCIFIFINIKIFFLSPFFDISHPAPLPIVDKGVTTFPDLLESADLLPSSLFLLNFQLSLFIHFFQIFNPPFYQFFCQLLTFIRFAQIYSSCSALLN